MTASADFSARRPSQVSMPHLRKARARRRTPAMAWMFFCCSSLSVAKVPRSALGFAAGFACGLRVADSADTMEPRGGAHDAAHVLLAEGGCGVCAAQSVEK